MGFGVPNPMFFWYLQHALNSQFPDSIPSLESLYFVEVIPSQDPMKLILIYYNYLLLPAATVLAYQPKFRWTADVGEVTDEEWDEILGACIPQII